MEWNADSTVVRKRSRDWRSEMMVCCAGELEKRRVGRAQSNAPVPFLRR